MHPKNRYAEQQPDFAALAEQDEQLLPYVSISTNGKGLLDFTDPEACRSISASPQSLSGAQSNTA